MKNQDHQHTPLNSSALKKLLDVKVFKVVLTKEGSSYSIVTGMNSPVILAVSIYFMRAFFICGFIFIKS